MASNCFRLKCLGGLILESDDVVLPPSALQRRRLALLVLLARAGDIGLTRDRVMALLWPEASTDAARRSLDQLLYTTRRDLGKRAVISEGPQLRINREVVTNDVDDIERLLSSGDLESAVALYGGPFLDGVHPGDSQELENWVCAQREELEQKMVAALETLAERATDAKRRLHWLQRRMSIEGFSDAGALALIQAYAEVGDIAGALRYGNAHCARLEEEIGSQPAQEIVALLDELAARPKPKLLARVLPRNTPSRRMWWPAAAAVVLLLIVGTRAVSNRTAHIPPKDAQELFLRGRNHWNERSREGLEKAVVLMRRAVERDPLYAEAHAALGEAYALLGYHGFMPAGSAFTKAKAAARRAIELEAKLAPAHTALGIALQSERNWREAERAFQRAIEYDPHYATVHQHYALLLRTLKRDAQALMFAQRATALDPLSIQISNTYAIMLRANGQVDSALSVYKRIVTDEPDTAWVRRNPWVLSNFGDVATHAGQYELARKLIDRAIVAVPGHPRPLDDLAALYLKQADTARAIATFAQSDRQHPLYPAYRAFFYARLGQVDSAFVWFDRVEDWSPMLLMKLNTVPPTSSLYHDRRYAALQRRFGLPASTRFATY